jgi:hypothetical protein
VRNLLPSFKNICGIVSLGHRVWMLLGLDGNTQETSLR